MFNFTFISNKRKHKIDSDAMERSEKFEDIDDIPDTPAAKNLMKGFCLSICYAASTGGVGSLVGTTPNLILKGYFDEKYPNAGLNFITYMVYALPISVILVLFIWVVICLIWLPKQELLSFKKKSDSNFLQEVVAKKYKDLGSLKWKEGSMGGLFLLLVALWLTRDFNFFKGWAVIFPRER